MLKQKLINLVLQKFSLLITQPRTAIPVKNCPIMQCELLNECTSCMLMDCVSGDVLLKKRQYTSCKLIILATNVAVNGCYRAVVIPITS